MENRKLNETESIELITQMVRNTRRNIVVGSGNQFLVWGVSILSASIIIFVISLGSLFPLLAVYGIKDSNEGKKLFTYVDKRLKYVWITCGTFCVLIPVFIGVSSYLNGSELLYSIIPFIELLIVSIGVAICRFSFEF